MESPDMAFMGRVCLNRQLDAVFPGAAAVLLLVPFAVADLGQEMLHRRFVFGKHLPEQDARIPSNQDIAEIKDDGMNARRRFGLGSRTHGSPGWTLDLTSSGERSAAPVKGGPA
jgi:hypothetical protein